MDRKFAVTVQHGGKHKSFYISAGMTLGALKLLKLQDKELRNNDAKRAKQEQSKSKATKNPLHFSICAYHPGRVPFT